MSEDRAEPTTASSPADAAERRPFVPMSVTDIGALDELTQLGGSV
jgi:hypothetical protein